MSEMEQSRIKSTNLDYLNKLARLDLLVIDDFGLMDLDLDKCRDLFEVLDTRDGRRSTVVISQFPVNSWFDMFSDNTYADAFVIAVTVIRTHKAKFSKGFSYLFFCQCNLHTRSFLPVEPIGQFLIFSYLITTSF